MENLKNIVHTILISLFLAALVMPPAATAQGKAVKLRLVKRAKVNKEVYKTLSGSPHGSGLRMLPDMTIAAKQGFLLFDVQGANSYLSIATDDEASKWSGESEVRIDPNLFRLVFRDGGYLWSKCICPNVNDGCSLSITSSGGDGPSYTCQGLECCQQKWGYVDAEGTGTVYN